MMPTLTVLLSLVLLPFGSWTAQDPGRASAKPVWPKKAGVYAMAAPGPVELG